MNKDPIRGKTLTFAFDEGAMAGKAFEHRFDVNGTVSFRMVGGDAPRQHKPVQEAKTKYEVATLRDGICAVSYLSSAGYTLTTVLDFTTRKLVAFSSNEKMLSVQRGSFEESTATAEAPPGGGAHAGAAHR